MKRPDETLVGQPVRSLQTMLRTVAESDNRQPSVVPDGIYGPDTIAAVTAFQRRVGLPVTGITDQATWDTLIPIYEEARIDVLEAEPLQIILNPGSGIRRGQQDPNLYIVQAILTVLSQFYSSVTAPGMTGILDVPTADSLSSFQALSGLPMTGHLDKKTWKHLALHYPLAANALTPPDTWTQAEFDV